MNEDQERGGALLTIAGVCLVLVMGVAFIWAATKAASIKPGANYRNGYVKVERFQAVAPEYQQAPITISCPNTGELEQKLCAQAGLYARSVSEGKEEIASTKMGCMPGSPSLTVSGEMGDEKFKIKFDCNRTSLEKLRNAAEAVFNNSQRSDS